MRISDMNWMQVRDHAARDDRAVLPIGSTEQHAHLSLSVDTILSERVAVEAAEPLAHSGVSGDRLRIDAELRRISRHGDAAHEHDVRARDRRARRHRANPASAAS